MTNFSPFRSFWMAGYEGADHINSKGLRLDMNELTQHASRTEEDYRLLAQFNIRTVRESIGWRLTERDGRFDFSSIDVRARLANTLGLQVIWTLCHYGFPQDVDPFSAEFPERFARFSRAAAEYLSRFSDEIPFFSPVNEISFFTWAICHSNMMYPYRGDPRASEFKRQLVRAAIAGCDAIWDFDPRARIVQGDPIIHAIAPPNRPDLKQAARAERDSQFEAWDLLGGLREPELGGDPKYLDILSLHYYHSNQWEHSTNERLHWHLKDPRRMPMSDLIQEIYERYQRPLIIGETSHVGVGRGEWISEIASEAVIAIHRGLPLQGICLYPIADRQDWENLDHWHNSGLWDYARDAAGGLNRVLNQPYARELHAAQQLVRKQLDATVKDSLCPRLSPFHTDAGTMSATAHSICSPELQRNAL